MRMLKRDPNRPPVSARVSRTLFHGYQLLDDAVWHAVNKPVDKLVEKCGIPKPVVTCRAMAAGVVANVGMDALLNPALAPIDALIGFLMYRAFRLVADAVEASRQRAKALGVESATDYFLRRVRMIYLAYQALTNLPAAFQSKWGTLLCSLQYFVFGAGLFLLSDRNGMGHKAKDFIVSKAKALAEKARGLIAPAPHPSPVPIAVRTLSASD